jgi:hypothetical protein
MSTTILEIRVREEMAGAVLKEVAALEPAERLREAQSLTQILAQAVLSLEELWAKLRDPLEAGVSPSDAAIVGRILTRSANLMGSSLDLLVAENPSLQAFRQANMARLQHIKAQAAALQRLVDMAVPTCDPLRLRTGLEQMDQGQGIDAAELLASLKE